jgi:subtilase family serine protease
MVAGSMLAGVFAGSAAAAPAAASKPAPPPPTMAQCLASSGLPCYSPAQLQQAYDLRSLYRRGLDGSGSTIVIVDPFGSPTIGKDLATFDAAFGLPNPPALRVLQPVGAVPAFDPQNQGMAIKAGETTLDVEWAHAIAPRANILLVETPVMEDTAGRGFRQFMSAEEYVIRHDLGDVISQSFSLPERNFGARVIRALRRTYVDAFRHRVTVLAATNDNGVTGPNAPGKAFYTHRIVEWPASDPLVTGVGGTRLHLDAAGDRTSPDTAWNDTFNPLVSRVNGTPLPFPWSTGGGVSSVFARPSYQRSVARIVGRHRGIPDISMSAAFSGGVLVFLSFIGKPTWIESAGGTSEATPEFSGIVAIADQYARTRLRKRRLGLINPTLYDLEKRHAAGIIDVTSGNNTVAFNTGVGRTTTVMSYTARRGYDLATGIGTLDAARLVPALARGR